LAVRDFTDAGGAKWRVWSVALENLQTKTAVEDYLGDYGEGWLCFESAKERRRLALYPPDWESMSETELRELLLRAAVVGQRRSPHVDDTSSDASK